MTSARPNQVEAAAIERLARQLLSPHGRHRLLNDTVFQFNDHYRRFWSRNAAWLDELYGERVAFFVPSMFDKASRTFNWIALSDPFLGHSFQATRQERDSANAARRTAISRFLDAMVKAFPAPDEEPWRQFVGRFSDSPHAQAALKCVEGYIRVVPAAREGLNEHDVERLWIAVATLYSCYSHPRDQYLEGLFYTVLESFGGWHPDLLRWPIFGSLKDSTIDLAQWLKLPDIAEHAAKLKLRGTTWCGDAMRTMKETGYRDDRVREARVAKEALLDPLLMHWSVTEGEETKPFSEWLGDFSLLVMQPLYDVWIGNQGFGSLQGILNLLLKPDATGVDGRIGKPSLEAHYHKLLERCSEFAQEVGRTSIQRALATPIAPPYDLVRHFLRILKEVQDWEEAAVFRHGEIECSYHRERHPPTSRPVRTHWVEDESPSGEGPTEQAGGLIEWGGSFYMWWTCEERMLMGDPEGRTHHDLWSHGFLPDLTEEERLAFQATSIRFRFPKACRIPGDAASRSLMVEFYLRQQLELMRVLIPKVRARRAALRNAVSAIMGRNLSHNIGSHVLARYANQVSGTPSGNGKPDPRSDFLLYLQRRMDFLAEVATSDRSLSVQPLALKDQVEKLNFEVQRQRYDFAAATPEGGLPLLQNIAGKRDLDATVVFEACDCADAEPLMFACPGGEVGVHALFVILENIIRNSARHNDDDTAGPVSVTVRHICSRCARGHAARIDDGEASGLMELNIVDARTRLTATGVPLSRSGDPDARPLHKHINQIIQQTPIIDEDGRPSPHSWGIREMQVCAQYLRRLSLSDLEGVPNAASEPTDRRAPLIEALCLPMSDGGHCLAYAVCLQQPMFLALLEGDDAPISEALPRGLRRVTFRHDGTCEMPVVTPSALADLGSYGFLAYPPELRQWIEANRGELPVRLIELPARSGGRALSAESLIQSFRQSPLAGLEVLHEAYMAEVDSQRGMGRLPRPPVGLVIAQDGLANVAATTTGRIHLRHADANAWEFEEWVLELPPTHRLCLWLDHASEAQLAKIRARAQLFFEWVVCCEPCVSGSLTSHVVAQVADNRVWELLTSATARVLVLDERVQAEQHREIRGNLTLGTCWRSMGVEVPRADECSLDFPDMSQLQAYLARLADRPVDHALIHATLLERLCAQGRHRSVFDALGQLIADGPLQNATIILVTGRGLPVFAQSLDTVGGDDAVRFARRTRYLPVSAVLECITRYPSKIGLMRAIWSASGPRMRHA